MRRETVTAVFAVGHISGLECKSNQIQLTKPKHGHWLRTIVKQTQGGPGFLHSGEPMDVRGPGLLRGRFMLWGGELWLPTPSSRLLHEETF